MFTRTADAHWRGSLSDGHGQISVESGAFEGPYSFESRFEQDAPTATNPEELLGAAHAGCFTMQLSHMLAEAGHPPAQAYTTAHVQIDKVDGGFEIPAITLTLRAKVPGIAEDEFMRIAHEAKETCPLSKVLRAAEITLDATLTAD